MDNNIINNNENMNEKVQNTSEEVKAVETPAAANEAVSETVSAADNTANETAGTQPANETNPVESANSSNTASDSSPDFSKYRDTASNYVHVPRQTVYINNNPSKKKAKAPKARRGAGAVAAIVAVCMVFSGGAAFAGTYAANRMNGSKVVASGNSGSSNNTGSPSVIFQSFGNGNKTAGTYEQVAAAVTPTVVEITTESVATDNSFWGGSYIVSGAGSGVIISEDGLIITNNHVVSGANAIKVKLNDGTEYDATLVGTDSDSDIAVIKVNATGLPCALIGDSDTLNVGQEVVAVGNPLGEFGGSVTNGIVSGL